MTVPRKVIFQKDLDRLCKSIAEVIKESRNPAYTDEFDIVARRFAGGLRLINPCFDRAQFLEVCGVTSREEHG